MKALYKMSDAIRKKTEDIRSSEIDDIAAKVFEYFGPSFL